LEGVGFYRDGQQTPETEQPRSTPLPR
jgi:hypothetical protein